MIVAEAETIALRAITILVTAISMLDSMADSAADSIKTANAGMTNVINGRASMTIGEGLVTMCTTSTNAIALCRRINHCERTTM